MLDNKIRIIGGKWRGRKIIFPDVPGLRPTSDRIRETLFNWLSPILHNTRCLDLFAGSGALGFEALSRGAKQVVFVDSHPDVAHQLKENKKAINTQDCDIIYSSAEDFIKQNREPFDIIFLDPPFHQNLVLPICKLLIEKNQLAPSAHIYIETEAEFELTDLPEELKITKEKKAGQVKYYLLSY